jgi:tRNA A-37 threonylcarbamoyl transferase component Bud32
MSTQTLDVPPIRKVATAPAGRDRLRREAAALRRCRHPNVARLASFLDLPDRSELLVERAGDLTLLGATPPDGAAAIALAASLAATLADLHETGMMHGRLTPDHVVVAPGGRAVLCGLSEAGAGDPAADVRALATLLELLATAVAPDGSRRDRRAVATMLAAAERVRTEVPTPSAADVVGMLGTKAGSTPRTRAQRPPLALVVTAASALLVLAGAGAWLTLRPRSGAGSGTIADRQAAPEGADTAGIPATTTTLGVGPPVRFVVDGATFEVGQEGDVVVTGDWDCDGATGAALLRPRTGELFVFDALAGPGERVPGRALEPLPGAVTLETITQPDGCDSLVARAANGAAEVVAVRP